MLPAKFVGGVLGIGSGLVLGREGPTVHMGAAIGAEAARRARLPDTEVRMMQTAVGGAGLAVAFNAPIGGTLFVLEEVTKSFRVTTVLTTLFAAGLAVGCSRLMLGNHPDFQVDPIAAPALAWLPLCVIFGLLTGCLGAVYNRLVLRFLDHAAALRRIPTVAKASVIGGIVGLTMFTYPLAVGGGDPLTERILSGQNIVVSTAIGYLAVRFIAGPLSYAAAVPGGLFAPLLAVGALWGTLFVAGIDAVWPGNAAQLAVPMALVGMAAFFAATVRAPVTGMVLVVEMTATTEVLVPMMAATAAAILTAYVTGSPPIYDSLRERMPTEGSIQPRDGRQRIDFVNDPRLIGAIRTVPVKFVAAREIVEADGDAEIATHAEVFVERKQARTSTTTPSSCRTDHCRLRGNQPGRRWHFIASASHIRRSSASFSAIMPGRSPPPWSPRCGKGPGCADRRRGDNGG